MPSTKPLFLTLVCALNLLLPLSAASQPPDTAEEQTLLSQARAVRLPALAHARNLRVMFIVDENVQRALLLSRCPHRAVYGSTDRLSNPAYRAILDKTAERLAQLPEITTSNTWSAQNEHDLLQLYRKANAKKQAQIKTDMANLAATPNLLLEELDALTSNSAVDISTGRYWPLYPQWVAEYARLANLYDPLINALNDAKPGRGSDFAKRTSITLQEATSRATAADASIFSETLSVAAPEALSRLFAKEDKPPEAAHSPREQPATVEVVSAALFRKLAATKAAPVSSDVNMEKIYNAVVKATRESIEGTCDSLKAK
jgi:hypothetical protein